MSITNNIYIRVAKTILFCYFNFKKFLNIIIPHKIKKYLIINQKYSLKNYKILYIENSQ